MLNRIILIGRLTRDPELRYTNTGKAVARFTLAVDRPFKNQAGEREADFINVVVWGQMAENCSKYLSKGKLAAVDGRLEIRSFEGQDGQKRWVAEVAAETVRFLSPRESQPEPGWNDGLQEAGDLPF
ncbi:single-stranded DNA-binding protein [Carboxydocella sp. ULO1]|uniref:single-stranded DNA-binding protein n=1 Tax=Carboxydocella sp. ULO1 TaxID=1926599 RepID=UPI0009ABD69A|nr:single-stranded DNA-binding protein [Carboxydocella sp. ULO1]GAW29384.1 single-stranded DNA-binding protein [Carboxydocella sp. ULO1]